MHEFWCRCQTETLTSVIGQLEPYELRQASAAAARFQSGNDDRMDTTLAASACIGNYTLHVLL